MNDAARTAAILDALATALALDFDTPAKVLVGRAAKALGWSRKRVLDSIPA